ncbi:MAG TPA: EscV/YscV/HrcV family type III secretion system export apparatus protein, partial [Deltaproteobacteria bacterium]|nr:EscV/YscV/HrcV family type III secretion system export apparatus protein [Deltaproteobacteria bacterium]
MKLPQIGNFNQLIAKYSDILLAFLVVAVIGMIIIPLPTWLIDILLTINITIGILILLVSLYISDALKIASFPTLLLITTIFRLALNISSTRLILSRGDAGEVIRAFGSFVLGGTSTNAMVVGMVLFLIITLVNFIVIAKGAERV